MTTNNNNNTTTATPLQVEAHYSHLTALLVGAIRDTLGQTELTPFAERVIQLVEQDNWRQAYNWPLDKDTFHTVAELYGETFIDPYDLA